MATHDEIALVAFARFEGRGCVDGRDVEDWLWAERRLHADPDVNTAAAVARIETFVAEFFESRVVLKARYGIDADLNEIQTVLMERLGIEDAHLLIHKRLTASTIADLVADFDFSRLRPTVLECISPDEKTLPESLPTLLEEEVLKHQGERWEIHQNDPDPFPHRIHGHLQGTPYKLDFRNGNIYNKRNLVSAMRPSDLKALRKKARTQLPALEERG